MATKVYWYLQNRVIVNEHYGEVTFEILIKAVDLTVQMAKDTNVPFHLIIDAEKLNYTPSNLRQLSRIANGLLASKYLDTVIIVTTNPLHIFIGNAVIYLLRKATKVVGTRDEALAVLQQLDSSLPNLSGIAIDPNQIVELD
jgi:hypothetical protein